jgi:hypothetical protein
MNDLELFEEAVGRQVAPAPPSFFEDFWSVAALRERAAARRWRGTAIVAVAVAVASSSAAAVLASARPLAAATVVDQTWSCPVAISGAARLVQVAAAVTTPRELAYLHFTTASRQAWTMELGGPTFRVDDRVGSLTWGTKSCRRASAKLPLAPSGLPSNGVVTQSFVGSFNELCKAPSRVLFRVRTTLQQGKPIRARLFVATERTRRPLAYVDWSSMRIASWFAGGCEPPGR